MNLEEKILQKLDKRPRTRAEIVVTARPKVSNFYVKKEDKYNYVRHRLEMMKPYFLDLLGIESFESINHVSDSSYYTYGIIVSPSGSKLGASNIFISSNIDDSNDVVVKLNVSHLQRYSVFPGQVVVVKGKNMSGNEIVVEVLHCMPIVDVNTVNCIEKDTGQRSSPIVIAASGPYGSESLFDVLDGILENAADVLILVGPFVSHNHESMEYSPTYLMNEVFVRKINGWLSNNEQSKVVLVPSTRDLTCFNVFPQASMEIKHSRIYCVGNPGEFLLNDCLIAVSSLDAPLELSSEECFHDSGIPDKKDMCGELLFQSDRMTRIAYHLIFQRTFLPVFPSVNTVSYSVPENVSMDVAPDIYIVTSKLKYFSREVGPSIVVNLGSQPKLTNKVLGCIRFGWNVDCDGTKPTVEFRNLQ